jgi:hypothetical protein
MDHFLFTIDKSDYDIFDITSLNNWKYEPTEIVSNKDKSIPIKEESRQIESRQIEQREIGQREIGQRQIESRQIEERQIEEIKKEKVQKYKITRPDPLFWSIYTSIYGEEMYNKKYNTNLMLEEKQKISIFYSKNKNLLKNSNVKLTLIKIQEIISDIMTNKKASVDILVAFAIYYKRIVYFTKSNWYVKIEPMHSEDLILIDNTDDGSYYVSINCEDRVSEIEKSYILLESYDKPLKSISSYKINELRNLAEKMKIRTEKVTKDKLYASIIEYIKK